MKRIEVKIHGKVIGVFFRANTANKVEVLGGITGFVRNNQEDMTVELIAEGEEESLKKLLEWCHKGPLHAKVEKVEVIWEDATKEFDSFEITN